MKDAPGFFLDPQIKRLLSILKENNELSALEMDMTTKKLLKKIPLDELVSFVVFFRFYREIFKTIRELCSEINFLKETLKR